MKIILYKPKSFGGVSVVSDSLNTEFNLLGVDSSVCSSLWRLFFLMLSERNTIFILSTKSYILLPFCRRRILVLHGFPHYGIQNRLERFLLILLPKINTMLRGLNVAVSHHTRAVYEVLFGVRVDSVILNGLPKAVEVCSNMEKKEEISYIGRIEYEKGVALIVEAFLKSTLSNNCILNLVGEGSAKRKLQSRFPEKNIIFHGHVTDEKKYDILSRSNTFISLNKFEPMGITFLEASYLCCNIVTPYVGGFWEFVHNRNMIYPCDITDVNSIASALEASFVVPLCTTQPQKFSYDAISWKNSAMKYIQIANIFNEN